MFWAKPLCSEAEADKYAAIYGDFTGETSARNKRLDPPLRKKSGAFPRCKSVRQILLLYSRISPRAAPADAIVHLSTKLRPLLRRARELGAFINFDMESYALKNDDSRAVQSYLDRG